MPALNYRARTWDTARSVRVDGFFNGDLSPLHEVVAPALHRLPVDIRNTLRRQFYGDLTKAGDWDAKERAQNLLSEHVDEFMRERLDVAFDDWSLNDTAKQFSKSCERLQSLDAMQEFARSRGVTPPEVGKPANRTRTCFALRLLSSKWWRRALRTHWTRQGETHLRAIGLIQRRKQVYASDHMVRCRAGRKARNAAILKSLVAVSDMGDQLELFQLAKGSQSNPAIRRAELMVRLRGFEEIAKARGDVADFFTLTCPSAFHATHVNGSKNERFEGHKPRDAQAWLCRMWARVRAKIKRLSLVVYGFRIAEPHHDGTPHWHMVLFGPSASADTLRTIIESVWLSEYHGEPGARIHRVKVQRIDPAKGSAAGYLAKYVAKNIDGFEVGEDFETEKTQASESCERVQSWASAHGIRQFQQIGGPTVGLWREAFRVSDQCAVAPIAALRRASAEGQWADFIRGNGGILAGRRGTCAVWRERSGEFTGYGELRSAEAVGLVCAQGRVRTRLKVWRIQRKAEGVNLLATGVASDKRPLLPSLGPVSITVRGARSVPSVHLTREHASTPIRGSPWMH